MRVLLRHIHYPERYSDKCNLATGSISKEMTLAFIRQPDLYSWLQRENIAVHGEIINFPRGSHMLIHGEMDRLQQLYYLMQWGSPAVEDMTG